MGIEIERKYLIREPSQPRLSKYSTEIWHITQTYLRQTTRGIERRVREIATGNMVRYTYTEKSKPTGNDLARYEYERDITYLEFSNLLEQRLKGRAPVLKTRYIIMYKGQALEIDIYTRPKDLCTLEIELPNIDTEVEIPMWIHVTREITNDVTYRNSKL